MIITKEQYKLDCFPKWMCSGSILAFFIAFILCTLVFGYPMQLEVAILSIISVLLFFGAGRSSYLSWKRVQIGTFEKRLYALSLILRFVWVLYAYLYFNFKYWEYDLGIYDDVEWYMPYAKYITNWISGGFKEPFSYIMQIYDSAADDVGYPVWLSIIYLIFGTKNDVFIPFVIKCLISAFCPVFISRIARNHFGENVARVTGVFIMVNPNMIFWCGSMFKETEMVFLTCWYLYEMDKNFVLNKKFSIKNFIKAFLIGSTLFFFRSALGLVAFLSAMIHMVLVSERVMSRAKKVFAFIFICLFLLIGFGESLRERVDEIQYSLETNQQKVDMEWRTERSGGNSFAKYAGAAVFAPLIFTIPFPTFNVALEEQTLQMLLSGGSYVKNIMSFFVIFAMFYMLKSGEWRKHVFLIAYTCGYLMALVFSNYAQSGRFHMPIMPMLMLWGAYGINLVQKNRIWVNRFTVVLIIEVIACLAWNWFKLKGRGMI